MNLTFESFTSNNVVQVTMNNNRFLVNQNKYRNHEISC